MSDRKLSLKVWVRVSAEDTLTLKKFTHYEVTDNS